MKIAFIVTAIISFIVLVITYAVCVVGGKSAKIMEDILNETHEEYEDSSRQKED